MAFSKFWEKMLRIDPETHSPFGQETISLIDSRLLQYEEQFKGKKKADAQFISQRMKGHAQSLTKEELIAAYLEEMKKDLIQKDEDKLSRRSDASMLSIGSDGSQKLPASNEDIIDEDIFEAIKESLLDRFKDKGEGSSSKSQ